MKAMGKLIFALFAAGGSAFSALAPLDMTSAAVVPPARDTATSVRLAWRQDAPGYRCRVDVRWRRDYSGQSYLNKIRICA